MRIEIASRFHPYSHLPGTYFILPGSSLRIQIFPTLLTVEDLSLAKPVVLASVRFDLQGPLEGFTVVQDLEKGFLKIFGTTKKGFFRYRLIALSNEEGICIHFEKVPDGVIQCKANGPWQLDQDAARTGMSLFLSPKKLDSHDIQLYQIPRLDRLSLGSHKVQDWERIFRTADFLQILPLWYRLGQLISKADNRIPSQGGTLTLLDSCQKTIEAKKTEDILPAFRTLFLAGFDRWLAPRLFDTDFHGVIREPLDIEEKISPLILLSKGTALIRSLFVQWEERSIHLLPALPPEFHCGRFLNIDCGAHGMLCIEWTKKALRKVIFKAYTTQSVAFTFARGEKRCRLRLNDKDRGTVYQAGNIIELTSGQNYWFDNFER